MTVEVREILESILLKSGVGLGKGSDQLQSMTVETVRESILLKSGHE